MSKDTKLICRPESGWGLEGAVPPSPLSGLDQGRALWGKAFLWLAGSGMGRAQEMGLAWMAGWVIRCLEHVALSRALPLQAPWDEDELREWGRQIPAIKGAEYVDDGLMRESGSVLWQAVRDAVAAHGGDCDSWLDSLGEHWSLVGKVVFHLAELPAGGARPFGFLATYAGSISEEGKPQHVPLARLIQKCRREGSDMSFLLAPLRKAAETSSWLREWLETQRLLRAESLSVDEAYFFIREVPLLRKAGLVTRMPAQWGNKLPARVVVQVDITSQNESKVKGRPMWEFDSRLALNGQELTPEELEKIKNSETGLISLRGHWVEVDRGKVESLLADWQQLKYLYAQGIPLSGAMRLLAGMGAPLPIIREGEAAAGDWSMVQAGEELKTCLQELRQASALSADPGVKAVLRPYQKEGVSWMLSLYKVGLGGCLADDMGLGKTVQVLAFLSLIHQEKKEGMSPVLVVSPSSLLANWAAEMERFVPHLRFGIYHGSGSLDLEEVRKADIVLTTYSLLHRREELKNCPWEVVVFDEAQNLKNTLSLQAGAAGLLTAGMKIALTGTPIENGLSDLWSVMNIVNPGLMGGSCSAFLEGLSGSPENDKFGKLRRLISPVILRRMKSDSHISLELPPKTELVQRCRFTRRQALLYEQLTEELRKLLFSLKERKGEEEAGEEVKSGRNAHVLKYMLRFKQLCDHPSLLNGDNLFEPEEGGKFIRLRELAEEWASRQEKVLVFTQFREMCRPLSLFLRDIYGQEGLVMHGGTSLVQRKADVQSFQSPGGPPFYVLSVKTAGTGLTLTEAAHVVHFDRWWNPSVENQASDRAYRLGQKKAVFVHKFMVPGTLEERIDRMIFQKKELARDVLAFEKSAEKVLCSMNDEELISFITGK